jgi:hypothetical protein
MSAGLSPKTLVRQPAESDELWLSTRANAFEPEFAARLRESHDLICAAKLTLHPSVKYVTLHGSRGPAGGAQAGSDVDLCLHTNLSVKDHSLTSLESTLYEVAQTTLTHWRGPVSLDLAVMFDVKPAGQSWFEESRDDAATATRHGLEGFGLYKVQKGFTGFVPSGALTLDKMTPFLVIWRRNGELCEDDCLNALACCDLGD